MEKIELRSLEAVYIYIYIYISRLLEKRSKTNIIRIENNKIAIKPKSKKI